MRRFQHRHPASEAFDFSHAATAPHERKLQQGPAARLRQARICSYECTLCAACVERLGNVCPNGGGFTVRPVRPVRNWKRNNHLGADPASTAIRHRPVDFTAHASFATEIRVIPPGQR